MFPESIATYTSASSFGLLSPRPQGAGKVPHCLFPDSSVGAARLQPGWAAEAGAAGTGRRAVTGDKSRGHGDTGRAGTPGGPLLWITRRPAALDPFLFESQTPLGPLRVGSYQVPVNEGQPSPAFQAHSPSTFQKGRKCEALRPTRWVVPGCQSIEDALDSRVPHLPFLQEAHLLPGDNQEPQVLVVGSLVP